MYRRILHILHGAFLWNLLRIRFRINDRTVVLILVNENEKLDYYTLAHLQDYMDRKSAKGALILLDSRKTCGMVRAADLPEHVRISWYPRRCREVLYAYYSFYKFSDKVVFTYVDRPKENLLGRALRETAVNEEDAACLGLYRLRRVPAPGKERTEGRADV